MIGILAFVTLWQAAQPAAGTPFISEDIACAPISLSAPPAPSMRVVGGAEAGRFLFGPGEALVVNAGSTHGVRTGQQYYVRRRVNDRFTPVTPDFQPISIHTAGWVTIVGATGGRRWEDPWRTDRGSGGKATALSPAAPHP